MFDIGWSELLIIGVVALIVVGPKDLPKMFRTLGQVTGKLRAMSREFTRAMDAAADEAGVKDVARTFRDTTSGKSLREAAGLDDLTRDLREMERSITTGLDPDSAAKPAPRKTQPLPPARTAADPGLAARNADLTETEAARLARADRAAEARRQAAEIRARREAEAQAAPPPPAAPEP